MAANLNIDEENLVTRLLQSGWSAFAFTTGGGASVAQAILARPGASRFLIGVAIPYGETELQACLGSRPQKHVSNEVAAALAERAYESACRYREAEPVLGVGITAALCTDRERHGDEQFFASCVTGERQILLHARFEKGSFGRSEQESILRQNVLRMMAGCCGVNVGPAESVGGGACVISEEAIVSAAPLAQLLRGDVQYVVVDVDGRMKVDFPLPAPALLSGSFDPLHAGHHGMARAAAKTLKRPVMYELSIDNADKDTLSQQDVTRRMRQMAWSRPVVLTRAPRFVDKAQLFSGCTFVIGCDTAVRLLDASYYGGEAGMLAALEEIRTCGGSFLVAGRLTAGAFQRLGDIRLPDGLAGMFSALPEEQFRMDVSSTEIRASVM